MMLQKILKSLFTVTAIVLLAGCSTAVFPEVIEDDSVSISESGGKVIKEGEGLGSDEKNAAYEEMPDEDDVFADVVPVAEKNKKAARGNKSAAADKKAKPVKPLVEQKKAASAKTPEKEENGKAEEEFEPSVTYRLETIYFDNGSAYVSPEYNAKIREAANLVKNNSARIRVLGYASSRTRNTDIVTHKMANFKISSERAENVAVALRQAGVPARNITVEALSDTAPAYLEVMPEGERLNRRAEIYVSY